MRKKRSTVNVTRNQKDDTRVGSISELEILEDSNGQREWSKNGEWGAIPEYFKSKRNKSKRNYNQNIQGSSLTFSLVLALLLVIAGYIVGQNIDPYHWIPAQAIEVKTEIVETVKPKSYVYELWIRKQKGDYSQDFTIELPNGDRGIIRCHLFFPK